MPIPTTVSDLSTTPALNSPSGSESPTQGDDFIRAHGSIIRQVSDAGLTRVDAAASPGSSLVGFIQAGAGAVLRTVQDKMRDEVSVFDFLSGAQIADVKARTFTLDVTAAIQAAVTAVGSGTVFLPPGTYRVSSEITASASVVFRGAGAKATILRTTSATANVLVLNAEFCGVEHIGFSSSAVRSAGAYVDLTLSASNSHVRNFHMVDYSIGIRSTNSSTQWFENGLMFNPATNGRGIQLTGTVLGGGNDLYINKVTMSGDANVTTAAGINLVNTGAVNITDCDIIRHGKCLLINPGLNQFVAYVYCNNSYFDTATNGLSIEPTGGGFSQGVRMVGCWTSAHTDSGIKISGASYGIELIGHQALSNGVDGVTALTGATDTHVTGGAFCGNTGSGISIAANVSFFSAIGVRSGNGLNKPGNAFGIYIAPGTSNVYRVVGCDLTGNVTTNLSDGGTGTTKRLDANIGSAIGATGTITVTASPFTYTAGPQPELVYINQGTVSLVTVNGVSVFQSSNVAVLVQPNSTCVVAYSIAPSMSRTILL